MARKIPLEIQIKTDPSQYKEAIKILEKDLSDINNTEINVKLKTDETVIRNSIANVRKDAETQFNKALADYETEMAKSVGKRNKSIISKATTEMAEFGSILARSGELSKKFEHDVSAAFHTIAGVSGKTKTVVIKDLEDMGKGIKKTFDDAKRDRIIDTQVLTNELVAFQAKIASAQNDLVANNRNMTQAQIKSANAAISLQKDMVRSFQKQIDDFDQRNLRNLEATAKKYNQIKAWERINKSDRLFADAKQQMDTGRMDKINLNQLRGSLGSRQRDINKLEAEYEKAMQAGDIAKAQDIQRLLNTSQSRMVTQRATYSAIATKFGTYEDVIAGNLRTKQATDSSQRRASGKHSIDYARMKLASGEALTDAEIAQLGLIPNELKKSEKALKRKLAGKKGSKEELDEVARELESNINAQKQYNLKIEELQRKHQRQLEKDQKDADKKAKDQANATRNQKYLDFFNELNQNRHTIKNMSYREALDTRNALAGMGKIISGDPEAAEALASLRNELTTQMQNKRGRTFTNYIKSLVGIKGRNNPFGNANADLFHQVNKRVTNVSQMLGTSLYGMGLAGLGSAIVGGTIQSAAEKETMLLTLAGMSNSNMQFLDKNNNPVSKGENLMRSMQHANKLYERIRESAKTSLMTTGEFAEGFLTGAPRLRNQGFSEEQSLEITKKILMLGRATGLTSTAIMSDIRDFAAGNINSRSQVLMAAGLRKEELKKAQETGGSEAMFKYFEEKMASFSDAFEAIANTPAGRINAFKIELEQLQQTLGEKLVPILIPALERFREFIANWVKSGEAEKFIESFGNFINRFANLAMLFLPQATNILKNLDVILFGGVLVAFTKFLGQMGILSASMANPVTAVIAGLTMLIGGIVMFRKSVEDEADQLELALDKDMKNPNKMLDSDEAKKYLTEKLGTGTYNPKMIEFFKQKSGEILNTTPIREAYRKANEIGIIDDALGRIGSFNRNYLGLGGQQKDIFVDIANTPRGKKYGYRSGTKAVVDDLLKQGFTYEQIQEMARVAADIRDPKGVHDEAAYKRRILSEQRVARGMDRYTEAINRLTPIVQKELKTTDPKKVQPEVLRRIQAEEENSISTYVPQSDEEENKGQTVKLFTRADVIKAYRKAEYSRMERRINDTTDTLTNSRGRYLKPDFLLKGLGAGVSSAISNYNEFLDNNTDKGPYAVGIANAELLETMQKLKDSFIDQVKVVQENIANQKEQNRSLKENISLQEKSNHLAKSKFELSKLRPGDVGYDKAAMQVAFEEYSYGVAGVNASRNSQINKLNIDRMKYQTTQEVLSKMTPDQRGLYQKIMTGFVDVSQVPGEIMKGNASSFKSALDAGGTQSATSTTAGATPGGANLEEIAKNVKTTISASCAQFASKVLQKTGVAISEQVGAQALMESVLKAGGTRVNAAEAGDLVVIYGKDRGVAKDQFGKGYHAGVALNANTMADSSGGDDNRRRAIKAGQGEQVFIIRPKRGTPSTKGGSKAPKVNHENFDEVLFQTNPVLAIQKLFKDNDAPISKDIAEMMVSQMLSTNVQAQGGMQNVMFQLLSNLENISQTNRETYQNQNTFELGQKLSLMGLTGDQLQYQKEQNAIDSQLRNAQINADKYRRRRDTNFGPLSLGMRFFGAKLNPDDYAKQTESTAFGMTASIEESKRQAQIDFERRKKYEENLANVSERLANNFERLSQIDFSRFMEAVQNPFARIASITNPVQTLTSQVQENMQNQMDIAEVDIANQKMLDELYGIQREPGFYEQMRRDKSATIRANAMATMKAKMPKAFAYQTQNAVSANLLNALSTNAYGMFLGGNGVDVGGILSPFMNVMNNKFAQSGDILTALMTGQKDLDLKALEGTPYAQFLKGDTFDRKGARGYATSQMLGRIGGNLAGNYIGGQIFGANANKQAISLGTDLGGMAASAGMLGKAFGGPMGMIAGAVLGSLVGGLFGGRQLSAEEERFRQRQKEHFDRMEKLAEENNKLLRPSYDVYNTIKGDVLYGSSSRWFSSKAYSPLGNQVQLGTR